MIFMGRVIDLPMRFSPNADFKTVTNGEEAIAKVMVLLGTQPGEIDWRPDFGCNLRQFRHKNLTPSLEAVAKARIQDSFDQWLPSLVLIDAKFQRDERVLRISVFFNRRTGSATPGFPSNLEAEIQITIGA